MSISAEDVGPVAFLFLTFPGERADPAVIDTFREVVAQGVVTILDLVFVSKGTDGTLRQVEVDEDLDSIGLAALSLEAKALISDEDLEVVRESLEPGTSAVAIVYEQTWARKLAAASRHAGGEVALHLHIPREVVEAAIAAAV
ncbi:DUF1269 domain-containing protein [Rhodococcus sp. ACS1]|uniref:DUF1269 domain-containing protein n=1 Tax=Rhodococcus koreensis TaxID=99653 RepID=A0A1H4UE45_9NOCA|nr:MULTISPECIES: DUF6325 family protein [Rhodococcus]MDF3305035.1 DUF6325 family protein [Rhodococcus sp. T2V]PBC45790.1 DUF1269 domain-containing protein [Rhodococcus sp. ACS1]QSE81746.1 DUF1269 domain-containing protein [Rhodococcus koreensis]SEC66913.1 hypothetical protein SAMN04490239_4972 [Rhodococcus koreensis]